VTNDPISIFLPTPSLGITLLVEKQQLWIPAPELSTPSFGITKVDDPELEYLGGIAFNSLSRDHMHLMNENYIVIYHDYFQLPLSGSPSPIPGFFGSPRLSAAAPLRTDDF
jgi:hypothetical protein